MMSGAETAKNLIENVVDTKESTASFDIVKQLSNLESNIKNGTQLNMFKGLISTNNNPEIKDKASESMKKVGDILNIQVPFLGSIWALFGTKRPIDMLGSKEQRSNKKFLNGILQIFWFNNGIDGLHESYITEQLKWVDMDFGKNCFNEYKKLSTTDVPEDQKTRNICGLEKIFSGASDEIKTKIKDKIPENFENIKTALSKELPNNIDKININTIRMIDPSLIITENKIEKVDIAKLQTQPEKFIEAYLKTTITAFAQSGDEFIASDNINKDTFTLALFGNLTGEKFFVEGVSLGIISTASIWATVENTEKLENKKLDTLSFDEAKALAEKVFGKGPATDLLCKMSNNSPAMILRTIALGKHEWELVFGRKNKDKNRGQINIWTFQISAQPNEIVSKRNKNIQIGKDLLKQNAISYEDSYFKEIKNYDEETADSSIKKGQTDLLVWLGYIQNERWWEKTFTQLANESLSPAETQKLISTTIQWGIDDIGKDVVAQITTKTTDAYTQIA